MLYCYSSMSVFKKIFGNGNKLTWNATKALIPGMCMRMSTDSSDAKMEKISNNMTFRTIEASNDNNRPLVVIFSWLLAKSQHISKYGDFYLDKGYDVLTLKVEPKQLLWPTQAQKVVQQALEYIDEEKNKNIVNPLLIHGFSVGGYLYGEFLVKLKQGGDKYRAIANSIQGQIFDSIVDYKGIPGGVSKAMTPNPILRATIKGTLELYLGIFKKQVMTCYELSQDTVIANKQRTPSMFLYSKSDIVSSYTKIEEVIDGWKEQGIEVHEKRWDVSPHVTHMYHHPDEYLDMLNTFLEHIGIQKEQDHRAKHSK
ncbi:unnamed protein product [Owenia fusiformis]|uniref:Uncharacterized protein n=1 Tax=Owenia fusiformis TaxID=6347 RepID=A0A8J1U073_OWEFU|nr:unnamed protein product [Owenia fusiformis]